MGLLYDRVETGPGASAAVRALEKLHEELGVGAAAAALTFVAYLVGALWEAVVISVSDWRRKKRAEDEALFGGPLPQQMSVSAYEDLRTVTTRSMTELDDEVHRALEVDPAVTESRRKALSDALFSATTREEDLSSSELEALRGSVSDNLRAFLHSDENFPSPRDDFWHRSGVGGFPRPLDILAGEYVYGGVEETPFAWRLEKMEDLLHATYLFQVVREVQDELPLVARRLVGKQPELYLRSPQSAEAARQSPGTAADFSRSATRAVNR